LLASAGYRVIVPYLRGFGTTRFLSEARFRNGQQSALAGDVVAFMDALGIDRAIIAGFDRGARTACTMAALWPERCRAIVSVPAITLEGDANGAPHPASYAEKFTGRYTQSLIVGGVGHNLPQEAPEAFAEAVVEVGGY
jgi:pimeloyl-ACP methyl ester carboxylesterase